MVTKWYSLFSHTGYETLALSQLEDVCLSLEAVITNNPCYNGPLMYSGHRLYKESTSVAINKLLCRSDVIEDGSLITLNGYMHILPEDVLQNLKERGCRVYNIHPAPIQLYPELRGRDPQERMYRGIQNREYSYIGVVIHEVDEGVDTGKIVHWVLQLADPGMTKDELYERLHELGTQAWESFFRERMYENGENC